MTTHMENRKETVRPKLLLTPRRPTTIATLNVRTKYAGGKTAVIAEEMRSYNLSVLGLGENRWLQTGQVKLASGESILYSWHPDDSAPHTEGVAFMLSKEAQRALISWEPINSRIIRARFHTTHKKINLQEVQCYAPTNDAADETKDNIHNRLYHILQAKKEKDIIILMGDMNAKIGGNNNGYELVMGRHGLEHKATWVSADHTTENQIDHICISQRFRHSLLDVRVRRGADAGSDHHLVTARIQLKLKRMKPRQGRVKSSVQQFQDIGTSELHQVTLHNRFQALQ
ncbi:craniofacial development protein 2-like [Gadus morhua]|uniref:craniofacial development protein 2-like n=1 Tax=Gadus morhua TaxID=8049 RepID=UPI0011B431BF|nr:craniofacial development protein 2-like [Gadus morhua]